MQQDDANRHLSKQLDLVANSPKVPNWMRQHLLALAQNIDVMAYTPAEPILPTSSVYLH